MDIQVNKLTNQIQIIFGCEFGSRRVRHVTGIANASLDDATGGVYGIDAQFQIANVVQRVKDAEDIDPVLFGAFAEFIDNIVGVGCVSNSICTAQQHLEWDV